MNNKKPQIIQQTSSRNLKNIINETRIPLSKYMNAKATPTDKNMPYLDKLKQMFNKNSTTAHLNKQVRHSDNCARTQMNTIINDTYMYDQTPRKTHHERGDSGLTNPHTKHSNNKLRISQKKISSQQMINQIRNDLLKKRVVSNIGNNYTTVMAKTKTKIQIANYNNYLPIPNRNEPQTNQQISAKWGKIQLKEILGCGANANVREGYCHGVKLAVKIYEKYKLLQPKRRKRVYAQIQLLKSIPPHPNIIQVHEAFEDKRQIHVIFEHIESSITLHQYFRNNMLYLEQKQIQAIFARLVRGVAHLHSYGIAHRDIKPDNILVSFDEQSNSSIILKIIDFGFATIAHKADLHCGTPNFMAPQLLDKCIKYDPMSVDMWALGVTLFYLCEGRYPFKGYDEKDLYRAIRACKYETKKITSQPITRIIEQTLVADPHQRIQAEDLMRYDWVKNA